MRVVECASFVAGPSAGMALSQMGAEVIRVDLPGAGNDFRRWPLAPSGMSLYWASLNKGKKSAAIDYRTPTGRELMIELITRPDPGSGIFLDNVVGAHRLTYAALRDCRPDVIHVHIEGNSDGSPAVDYTVNAEVGLPRMTGPEHYTAPVNHVLPAWDFMTGLAAVNGLVAAALRRHLSGRGAQIDVALADVALAGVANLGWLAEAAATGQERQPIGNYVYGSFGVDFVTADDKRVMVVALTGGQWRALCRATGTASAMETLADSLSSNFGNEGERYTHREKIADLLRPWFAARPLAEVSKTMTECRILWSPYRSLPETGHLAAAGQWPVIRDIEQLGIGSMLAAASPVRWDGAFQPPEPAPALGGDTERILADILGLSSAEIGLLHQDKIVYCDETSRSEPQGT